MRVSNIFLILLVVAGLAVLEISPQQVFKLFGFGCLLLVSLLLIVAIASQKRTLWPSPKRIKFNSDDSMKCTAEDTDDFPSTIEVDEDILLKHSLADQKLDWAELQEAIRLATLEVADLSGWRHRWWPKAIWRAKLGAAKHGILPSVASLFFGLLFASVLSVSVVVVGSFPSGWSWLLLVLQFVLATAVVSWPIWETLRYEPGESEDPLAYVQTRIANADKLEAKWNSLRVDAEAKLARLMSKAEAIKRAIDEQVIRDSRLVERQRLLAIDWDKLSGIEFEEMLSAVYRLNGFQVRSTSATGDQGGDLLVQKDGISSCIQAKRYSSAVGNSAVQEVYAAKAYYGCDRCVVVTTNRFTKSAVKLAGRLGCELINREGLRLLITGGHDQLLSQLAPPPKPQTSSRVPTLHPTNEPADSDLQTGEVSMPFDREQAFQDDTPEQAQAKIRRHATKEWQDDYSMQLHVVEEEHAAYQKLKSYDHSGISHDVYAGIRRAAAKEWPSEYSMQLHTTEEQIDAYRQLSQLSPRDVAEETVRKITLSAQREWHGDFVMQLHTIEEQLNAYRTLHRQ